MTRSSARMRAVLIAAKLSFSGILLSYLLHRADLKEVMEHLAGLGLTAFLVLVGVYLASSMLVAMRWQAIVETLWRRVPLSSLWHYVLIGLCFNQALPSGVGGDAFRMWYLKRDGASLRVSVSSVVSDRFFAVIAICLISVLALPYLAVASAPAFAMLSLAIAVLILAAAAMTFLGLHRFLPSKQRPDIPEQAASTIRARAAYALRGFRGLSEDTFRSVIDSRGRRAMALAIVNQLAQGVVLVLIARSMGLALEAMPLLLLFPLVLAATMVPISFGGWGLREGAAVVVFGLAGIPQAAAVSISVTFGLVLAGAGLVGGALWAFKSRKVRTDTVAESQGNGAVDH